MASEIKRCYDFGPFHFDSTRLSLECDDGPVQLPPKSLQTLKVLLERRGETVSREELMSKVWHEAFVEDSNLTVAVSLLRKTLSAIAGPDELIQTVPREGYRFIADVNETIHISEQPILVERLSMERITFDSELYEPETGRALFRRPSFRRGTAAAICTSLFVLVGIVYFWNPLKTASGVSENTIQNIAILPLRSAGGDGDSEALRLGIADSLITSLNNSGDLNVRSINAVSRYLDSQEEPVSIGKQLDVDRVIDGTYQIVSGKIRINLRMFETHSGLQVWSSSLNGDAANIFQLQDRLTTALSHSLGKQAPSLGLKPKMTDDISAYNDYLKGQHLVRLRGWNVEKSIPYFERAVNKDPNFAAAQAGLAAAYSMTPGNFEKALPLIETALRLDPNLADAHAVRGFFAVYHEWDWETAEVSFSRAIDLDPNSVSALHWRGEYFKMRGRFAEAESDLLRAIELDPLSLIILADLAELNHFAGNDHRAVEFARQALAIDPDHQYANLAMSRSLFRLGRIEDAFEYRLRYSIAEHNMLLPEEQSSYRQRMKALFLKGGPEAVSAAGYRNQRLRLARSADVYDRVKVNLDLARYEAANGRAEVAATRLLQAFSDLQRTGRSKGFMFKNIAVNPSFESLRTEPKFQQILRQMGLS